MDVSYEVFNPYIVGCGYLGEMPEVETGFFYPVRVTRWYEFELYHSSDQGYIINRDHRINLQKGMLMIRKPGTVVRGVTSYTCHTIAFDNVYDPKLVTAYNQGIFEEPTVDELDEIMGRTSSFLMNSPEVIMVKNYNYVHQLFKKCMEQYIRKEEDFQLHAKRIIYDLISLIMAENEGYNLDGLNDGKRNDQIYQTLLRTKFYMEQNYKNKISLLDLADMTGYTKEVYCRKYKKTFQVSPIDYLVNVRLMHARKWLMTSSKTIEEIAYLCGFKSDSYFYRVFKKRSGMPPIAYRKAHQIY